jgi:phage terminase large subunit-like protein
LAERILRGIVKDDTTFVLIYRIDAGDRWSHESCWPKANPSLGVTLKVEHLRKNRDEALEDPSGVSAFQQYHTNTWPEVNLSRQGSVAASKWDRCRGVDLIGEQDPDKAIVKFLELNRDTPCFLGVDIGLTSDLSAVAMLWPRARFAEGVDPIARTVAVIMSFMPEVGLLAKEKLWQVPLSQWAREGFLDLLPGDMTDPKLVQKEVLELNELFTVRELGYDPWQFRVEAAELCERGIQCVEVPQLPSQLTTPIREFISAINRGDFVHFGNPLLSWNASNVAFAESEKHGGMKPEKIDPPHSKIDGVQALMNAWHRMLAAPPPSVYLDRGVLII